MSEYLNISNVSNNEILFSYVKSQEFIDMKFCILKNNGKCHDAE